MVYLGLSIESKYVERNTAHSFNQGMRWEFGSAGAGAVCSLGFHNQRVHIVLEASKSAGAKGDVPKICGFVHPLHPL